MSADTSVITVIGTAPLLTCPRIKDCVALQCRRSGSCGLHPRRAPNWDPWSRLQQHDIVLTIRLTAPDQSFRDKLCETVRGNGHHRALPSSGSKREAAL